MIVSPSELYWSLLRPSTLLLLLLALSALLLALRRHRLGQWLLVAALTGMLLPALLPVAEWLARPLEHHVPFPAVLPERVDGIIVLGGAVDARVTAARGQLALGEAGERMVAGASLARRYPDAELVFTGLYGATLAGEFTEDWAPGVSFAGRFSRSRVTFVGASNSTYEDALLTLEAVKPQAGEAWLLVTSALHMPRALEVFRTLGWRVTPYPVDYRTTGTLTLNPSLNIAGELGALDWVVREWGALYIYRALGRTAHLFPVVE